LIYFRKKGNIKNTNRFAGIGLFILARIFKILLRIVIWFLGVSVGLTLLFKWVPVPLTPLMVIRCVEQKTSGESLKLSHDWVSIDHIPMKLQLAVVCSEDQNYLRHYGFDWAAMKKAMRQNDRGKRLRGGSTISQQTAKNVFLWPGRSYVRKGFEAWFTLLIETFWSKERIMEVYLNSIEMGDGIYGAQAAAMHWFGKDAEKLTSAECAAIAAILPNPRVYQANPPSRYVAARKAWILKQMGYWGNRLDYDLGDDEEVIEKKHTKKKS
jgi:monofunctional glycosyltransferase